MQIYFIRHAESENNFLYHSTGSAEGRKADPQLTELGWEQARCLGSFLSSFPPDPTPEARDRYNRRGFGITHLYTSLFERAVQTATAVGEALGLAPVAWVDLHERRGVYLRNAETNELYSLPGRGRAYFEAHYPKLVLPPDLDDTGWWRQPPEPHTAVPTRAARVWAELLARHGKTNDRVALVSHGGFYHIWMHTLLNAALSPETGESPQALWFVKHNAAITRIDYTAVDIPETTSNSAMAPRPTGWWDVVYTNRVDFLPDTLIT